jgi:hypothetical protein
MDINNILTEIEAGHHDAHLHQLQSTIALRLHVKNRAAQLPQRTTNFHINVGTRVRINERAATGYLRNQLATVVEKKRSRIVIQLDIGPVGRFQTGRVIVPTTLVERV